MIRSKCKSDITSFRSTPSLVQSNQCSKLDSSFVERGVSSLLDVRLASVFVCFAVDVGTELPRRFIRAMCRRGRRALRLRSSRLFLRQALMCTKITRKRRRSGKAIKMNKTRTAPIIDNLRTLFSQLVL